MNEYWQLRENGDISEDCSNSHDKSPFRNNKEIIKPYLDFLYLRDQDKENQNILPQMF